MVGGNNNIIPFYCDASIQFEKGMKAYNSGNVDQATKYLREACMIDTKNAVYHIQLAMLLTEEKQWEAALVLLNEMEVQGEQEDLQQLLLTICYTNIGENELAQFYADEFVYTVTEKENENTVDFNDTDKDEKIHDLLFLAMECMERNTFEGLSRAILLLEKALNIDKSSIDINNLLAQSYICMKNYYAAEACLYRILEQDSNNIQAICNLIYSYHVTEQYETLRIVVRKIENLIPFKEIDRLKLGCALASLGEFEKAWKCLKNIRCPEYRMRRSYLYWMAQCSDYLGIEEGKSIL